MFTNDYDDAADNADRFGYAGGNFFDIGRFRAFVTWFTRFSDLTRAREDCVGGRAFEGCVMWDFRFRFARLWYRFAANACAFYRAFRLGEGFRGSKFDFVGLVRIGIGSYVHCEVRLSVFRGDICCFAIGIRICGVSIQYMCRIARSFNKRKRIDDCKRTIFIFLRSVRCAEGAVILARFIDYFLSCIYSSDAFGFG